MGEALEFMRRSGSRIELLGRSLSQWTEFCWFSRTLTDAPGLFLLSIDPETTLDAIFSFQ